MYASYDQLGQQKSDNDNDNNFNVKEIKSDQEKNNLLLTSRAVCINIYADWCGPCKATAPDYANLAVRYKNCAVVKFNYNNLSESDRNHIQAVPIYKFYYNGKQTGEVIGADIAKVEEHLKELSRNVENNIPNNQGPVYHSNSIRNTRNVMNSINQDFSQNLIQTESKPYSTENFYHRPFNNN